MGLWKEKLEGAIQGRRATCELESFLKGRNMSMEVKKKNNLRDTIILPTLTYGRGDEVSESSI